MALKSPLFMENNTTSQNADEVRLMLKGLLGGVTGASKGVAHPDHFKVTQNGTPNMSVNVAAGHLFLEGSRNSAQGTYHLYNDATINVPLSASDPTNPRIDVVYVRLRDSAYDAGFSGMDDAEIVVAQGTPAAVPSAPTITAADYFELARVAVAASASSITNANITERRVASSVWTNPRGRVGAAVNTSLNAGISGTEADIPSLSVTATLESGRYYEAVLQCSHYDNSGAATVEFRITNGSNVLYDGGQYRVLVAGSAVKQTLVASDITGSGSTTIKGRATSIAATGSQLIFASSTLKARLVVRDIGGYLP